MTLYPAHFTLEPANYETPPFLVVREEIMKSANLVEGIRALALSKPIKATFKLTPEALATLVNWVGKAVLARNYLRRRYAWVMPLAVIWILGSMPTAGDAAAGIKPTNLDPVGLGLGVVLIGAWACSKWRPHPALFLVDSVWFLVMAGRLGMDVVEGRSKSWLILVTLLVWMAITGLKHFLRFRGTRLDAKAV